MEYSHEQIINQGDKQVSRNDSSHDLHTTPLPLPYNSLTDNEQELQAMISRLRLIINVVK